LPTGLKLCPLEIALPTSLLQLYFQAITEEMIITLPTSLLQLYLQAITEEMIR
jgi:hypothetical protein